MFAARTEDAAVRRLFRKAQGWNRIAKAARGDHRWRAYELKKRAIERIREVCPDAVRVDSMEGGGADRLVIGVTVRNHGRLHLRLRLEDHAARGRWHDLAWC